MTAFLAWLIPTLILLVVAIVVRRHLERRGYIASEHVAFWIAVSLTIVLLVVTVVGVVRWVDLTFSTSRCETYGRETGRRVKLVDTGPIDWTCFVEVDGQWFPESQVYSQRPEIGSDR